MVSWFGYGIDLEILQPWAYAISWAVWLEQNVVIFGKLEDDMGKETAKGIINPDSQNQIRDLSPTQ